MKLVSKIAILVILVVIFTNCKKKSQPSAREEQLQTEISQPLLANEILEQEGVRFILNYSQTDAQINLNLDKRSGDEGLGPTLTAYQPYVNYFIEADKLAENSDYIISVEFKNVTNGGAFDVSVIGFTDLNKSKVFAINNNAFTPASNQTSKKFLKIHKGIRKFSFYIL